MCVCVCVYVCVFVCVFLMKWTFWVWNGSRKEYIEILENFYLEILMKCVWCPCEFNEMNFFEYEMDLEKGYIEIMECIGCPCVSNEMNFLSMKCQRIFTFGFLWKCPRWLLFSDPSPLDGGTKFFKFIEFPL